MGERKRGRQAKTERAGLGPGLRADSILNEMKTMLSPPTLDPRPSGTGHRFAKLSRSNVAELHGGCLPFVPRHPLPTPLREVS